MDRMKQTKELRFVVHEHQSSHHHFDFRLEMGGVLKSWAIPKGPSMNPAEKRLAIAVVDHPLEYGGYQGIIPTGIYGAGPVVIWDEGVYHLIKGDDPLTQLESGHLSFELCGKKLKGKFSLQHYAGREKQWLLFKLKDEYAQSHWAARSELTSERIGRLRVKMP